MNMKDCILIPCLLLLLTPFSYAADDIMEQGQTYSWELVRNGTVVGSGRITPDAVGLITIPKLVLTSAPATLTLEDKRRQE
jgi:hypothetical protein